MSIHSARRKYTITETKVREVTSDDQGDPLTKFMQEIADMTFNALAFAEIMPTIWKRMDDRGKKW